MNSEDYQGLIHPKQQLSVSRVLCFWALAWLQQSGLTGGNVLSSEQHFLFVFGGSLFCLLSFLPVCYCIVSVDHHLSDQFSLTGELNLWLVWKISYCDAEMNILVYLGSCVVNLKSKALRLTIVRACLC